MKAEVYVEQYKVFLDNIIDEHGINIIGYPEDKSLIKKVSNKYFGVIKPFGENKPSFQDSIIWESIVSYCKRNNPDNVVFISNNTKDFADKSKFKIHDQLEEDIQGILYYNSFGAFLEHEEDNLKDYFDDNYNYNSSKIKKDIKGYLEWNGLAIETIEHFLMNTQFEGDFFSGWGTDGYILTLCTKGEDPSDGMISEEARTGILLNGHISYSIRDAEFIDYVEQDIQLSQTSYKGLFLCTQNNSIHNISCGNVML
ncbi:PIN domain-containing protein [Aquibacillus sediminis]|uniref:PIN domain-containing protein n=1 Tax=Aquibacillus sediminis TaxID=2574734 RepID=UPI001FE987AA|nr:PIN domain-containing protein [Aquibacillus sediminis]